MSTFGRPPGSVTFSPTPPQRGSFPLDHDGECKPVMTEYLACLKRTQGTNSHACRMIAKAYLQCRMERNLMAPDEFKNLGFQGEGNGRKESKEESGELETRLEQLRRENDELVRKRREGEERRAGR